MKETIIQSALKQHKKERLKIDTIGTIFKKDENFDYF